MITTFGPVEQSALDQITRCQNVNEEAPAVLCADHHKGYSMPIGGVIAYRQYVSPSAVGFDIGCGNMAVKTSLKVDQLDIPAIMQEIPKRVAFGMGRGALKKVDSPIFGLIETSPVQAQRNMIKLAQNQLGTVGSGNHYVDLFKDEDGVLWIGVHFGSRGFGHKTASGFLAMAQGLAFTDHAKDGGMDADPVLIDIGTQMGQDYIECMKIAGLYAHYGRVAVVHEILSFLGTQAEETIQNHHNFAWQENHFGQTYWVHRKGATPAYPGQKGFVGGSMSPHDASVILEGVDSDLSKAALYSTVHGAGRVMSRTQAAGKEKITKAWQCLNYRNCSFTAPARDFGKGTNGSNPKCPQCNSSMQIRKVPIKVREGVVNWPAVQADLKAAGLTLVGAGADEAPEAYKRLKDVLGYHAGTVKILHELVPVGVAMAGPDIEDEFRD